MATRSMYATTQFHSTAHEVLCISTGRAKLCFGGDQNPGRVEPVARRDDPSSCRPAWGIGRRRISTAASRWSGLAPTEKRGTCYGTDGDDDKADDIARVGWLARDPFYGDGGPAMDRIDHSHGMAVHRHLYMRTGTQYHHTVHL